MDIESAGSGSRPSGEIISLVDVCVDAPAAVWRYQRANGTLLVETAIWAGVSLGGLGTHFHDEAQLVFVLAGSRTFEMRSSLITVARGQFLHIPARVPHRALAIASTGTVCLNAFLAMRTGSDQISISRIEPEWLKAGFVTVRSIQKAISGKSSPRAVSHRLKPSTPSLLGYLAENDGRIGDIAAASGSSRENFSRRFVREAGIPPNSFRIVERLNEARRLLRAEQPIAAVAAETGFADQSHFGRMFRRTFGTTPASYLRG
jgi:AraC-like DNA-binding protein/mannose-6-phosphate isomerase-like protein (cupin superfamily)